MQASTNEHGSNGNSSAESWITRCPQCSTAFRITRRHLMAAKGSVRCGSCLHVFKASSYIVGSDLPEELNFQPSTQQQQPQQQPQASRNSVEFSDDAFAVEPSNTFGQVNSSEEPEEAPSEDEAWAKAMLEEMNLEEDQESSDPDSTEEVEGDSTESDAQNFANALEEEEDSDKYDLASTEPFEPEEKPASKLSSLKDDPLDLSYRKQSLLGKVLWPAASAAAALVLVGQIAWANFAEISKVPSLRPLAASLCSVLPCKLPEQRDISKIQASHIVIRPDRNYKNALTIDAIITNSANFKQPYPHLIMSFHNEEQAVIGQRLLSPSEYLSGEAAGALDMPAQQPIHLALKVMSPAQAPHSADITFTYHQ